MPVFQVSSLDVQHHACSHSVNGCMYSVMPAFIVSCLHARWDDLAWMPSGANALSDLRSRNYTKSIA